MGNPIFIVAEIGCNHKGDLEIAKEMILTAKQFCKADFVKFQKRNPDVCVPRHQKSTMRSTPWGEMTYLEYKYKVEFGKKEYDIISNYAKEKGIIGFSSPFDIESADMLNNLGMELFKLASCEINNLSLWNM